MRESSLFGVMLRQERLKRGLKLWKFAAMVPFPLSNIQRIEAGDTEPRIDVAMRMLAALNVKAGHFMRALAAQQDWTAHERPDESILKMMPELAADLLQEKRLEIQSSKTLFGLYLRKVRLACELTQAALAERANYTVRSLIAVENGRQEPMVIRALRLVSAMGMDAAVFFDCLSLLRKRFEAGTIIQGGVSGQPADIANEEEMEKEDA